MTQQNQQKITHLSPPWSLWKLGMLLYVFVAGAAAINVFMLGLLMQFAGLSNLSPLSCVALGMLLAVPLTWLTARWVRRLMDEADGRS